MGQFAYDGYQWHFSNETVDVYMSDAVFQRHLTHDLASKGVDTGTYLQLLQYVDQVLGQRIQAAKHLHDPEYWLECHDPDVRILRRLYKLAGEGRQPR